MQVPQWIERRKEEEFDKSHLNEERKKEIMFDRDQIMNGEKANGRVEDQENERTTLKLGLKRKWNDTWKRVKYRETDNKQ